MTRTNALALLAHFPTQLGMSPVEQWECALAHFITTITTLTAEY